MKRSFTKQHQDTPSAAADADAAAMSGLAGDGTLVRIQTLSRVVECLPVVVYLIEPASEIPRYVNDFMRTLLRLPDGDDRPSDTLWHEHLHPDDRQPVLRERARSRAAGEPLYTEYRLCGGDGSVIWVSDHAREMQAAETGVRVRLGVLKDITERKQMDLALRRSRVLNETLLATVPDLLAHLDTELRVQHASASFLAALGAGAAEVIGQPLQDLLVPEDAPLADALACCRDGESLRREIWVSLPVLGRRCLDLRLVPRRDGDAEGVVSGIVAIGHDLTARRQAELELERLAHHDRLTGLPNRLACHQRLTEALSRNAQRPGLVALLLIDLDNFKQVNDAFGHGAGDRLLVELSALLGRYVPAQQTLARLGGDELAVITERAQDQQGVAALARSLLAAVEQWRFRVDEQELAVSLSIGISLAPLDARDAETMLQTADTAMYRAKQQGRNRYQFYDPSFTETVRQRIAFENGLRKALDEDGLVLHYQPQVSLDDGRILGVEALLRWHHPDRGILMPVEFLSIAEGAGIIGPIGEWVLAASFDVFARWKRAGIAPARLSLNVSAKQVADVDFPRLAQTMLRRFALAPSEVELELSEDLLVEEGGESLRVLEALAGLGLTMAIDDFGTGRSSLAYLRRLPVTRIKIDPSFIASLPDADAAAIVRSIVALARSLGLAVIAEGVETRGQADFLAANGCPAVQGYYFSEPMTPEALEPLLAVGRMEPAGTGDDGDGAG
jgi:diguanylate cyclase (GGDEF)-like protein/PAS domain S-box-containing protein